MRAPHTRLAAPQRVQRGDSAISPQEGQAVAAGIAAVIDIAGPGATAAAHSRLALWTSAAAAGTATGMTSSLGRSPGGSLEAIRSVRLRALMRSTAPSAMA